MDESLLDFQEKKKNFSSPKNTLNLNYKPGKNKIHPKTRKPKKPVKGQKDIRSALKQSNDLLSYTKDFNNICKQSGIDIDGEQLQLAIALSKSLQQPESSLCDAQVSSSLSSQERTGKIRITLQEYGFKIPEKKISLSNLKKSRKIKRYNKLTLTTEAEKQQIIANKYAQVLFENNASCKGISDNNVNAYQYSTDEHTLFQISSNITYDDMKNNHIFYVVDLIEKCSNYVGNLLRDWSEIPGRPVSPPLHKSIKMNISEIECSQEELDIVLSGSLKSCKNVLKRKKLSLKEDFKGVDEHSTLAPNKNVPIAEINYLGNASIKSRTQSDKKHYGSILDHSPKNNSEEITNVEEKSMLILVQQKLRSTSPDIFDDEVYLLTEKTDITCTHSQKSENYCESKLQDMDFTECVTVASILPEISPNFVKVVSQFSKENNSTRRKSNDFMEITECVVNSSQPICENIQNIDLTQSSDEDNIHSAAEKEKDNVAVTYCSDEDTLPFVNLTRTNQKILDETIILDDDGYPPINCNVKKIATVNAVSELNSLDTDKFMCSKTDESNTYEKLCLPRETSSENYEYHHSNHNSISSSDSRNLNNHAIENNITRKAILENNSQVVKVIQDYSKNSEIVVSHKSIDRNEIDLSQNSDSSTDSQSNVRAVYSNIDKEPYIDILANTSRIDLTQNTDSSNVSSTNGSIKITNSQHLVEDSGLGRNFDVSVDYDEIISLNRTKESKENNYNNFTVQGDTKSSEGKGNIDGTNNVNEDINKKGIEIIGNNVNNFEQVEIPVSNFNFAGTSIHVNRTESSFTELLYTGHDVNKHEEVSFRPDLRSGGINDINNCEHNEIPVSNYDFGGISILDNVTESSLKESFNAVQDVNKHHTGSFFPKLTNTSIEFKNEVSGISTETIVRTAEICTPYKELVHKNVSEVTPNNKYIIKTEEITPILDYESMSTPERNKELEKYGLKPFKRKRAVQLLTHLYNQTHPIVEQCSSGELSLPSKKRKYNFNTCANAPLKKSPIKSPRKLKSPKKSVNEEKAISGKENNIYAVTKELPDIKLIECNPEDWIFQKKEKAKMHSCRVPLHIAFHNYVSCRRALRESILRYEPINIDVIHKELTASGHRYDPKDLLKFLDKKCITVKTAESNSRKRH